MPSCEVLADGRCVVNELSHKYNGETLISDDDDDKIEITKRRPSLDFLQYTKRHDVPGRAVETGDRSDSGMDSIAASFVLFPFVKP
jgi:hypothetical protein